MSQQRTNNAERFGMANITSNENKFFDPGGEQDPAVRNASFIREGLNVQEGLYCYGLPAWGCLVVGCFRSEYELSPTSKLCFCFY